MKRMRLASAAVGIAMLASAYFAAVPAVHAGAPTGACCLPQSVCADIDGFSCEGQGGTFIGSDTSCASVTCDVTAAPLLSGAAFLVWLAAIGAAGVFAIRRGLS